MWKATLATILTSCTPLEDPGSHCGQRPEAGGKPSLAALDGAYYPNDGALVYVDAVIRSPAGWQGRLSLDNSGQEPVYLENGEWTVCAEDLAWEGDVYREGDGRFRAVTVVGGWVEALVEAPDPGFGVDDPDCGSLALVGLQLHHEWSRPDEAAPGDVVLDGTGSLRCEYGKWGEAGD